jgi:hypothetical protein
MMAWVAFGLHPVAAEGHPQAGIALTPDDLLAKARSRSNVS